MPRSSSVDARPPGARTRLAYRLLAVPFAAATVYLVAVFAASLDTQTVRSGVLTAALVTAVCTYGLVAVTTWGRSLALIVAVGMAGVGTLSFLSVVLAGGNLAGAIVMVAGGIAVSILLSRPVFTLPRETDA